MPREHAREMKRVVELHKEASVANEAVFERKIWFQCEAWKQLEQVQQWCENCAREFANETAALVSRAATVDAASDVRDQEGQVSLKMVAVVVERRVEDRYGRTLENLREESDFYKQHNESLVQQTIEA